MLIEVQYKDAAGQWKKLHTPPGVSMDEAAFAFAQCKQSGLVTRVIKHKADGTFDVTHGPFSLQRQR